MPLTYPIALIWLANGLYAKALGGVPRHQQIVAVFVGEAAAPTVTVLIGLAEIVLAAWVLSGKWPKLCGALQIGLILTMNVLENVYARDLLLHGGYNLLFAGLFCLVIAYHYFLRPRLQRTTA